MGKPSFITSTSPHCSSYSFSVIHPHHVKFFITFLLFIISLSSLQPICVFAEPGDGNISKIQLMRHSIENPNLVDPNDWELGGAATSIIQRISLSPGIAGHTGHLFSKIPILTNSFEVEFTFEIANGRDEPKPSAPRTQGFALWYTPHSLPAIHGMNENRLDWNLYGHFNQFSGLGVFFALFDRTNKLNPSISAAYNDGKKQWNALTEIPTNSGVYWRIRDGGEPMVFKLTVKPNSVLGQARFVSNPKWTDTFKLDLSLPVGGYLGLTADSGLPGPTSSHDDTLSERISLWDLHTYNLNLSQLGEEPSKEFKQVVSSESLNNLVKMNNGDMDTKEGFKMLSQMMTKLVMETIPRQHEISRALQLIEIRLGHLSVDLEAIEKHIGAPLPHHEVIQTLSGQLSGLQQLFDSHTQSQARATQNLIDVGRSIHERGHVVQGRHLETIQSHLSKQAKMNWAMFGFLVIMVLAIVVFVWKKTREIEKTHLF